MRARLQLFIQALGRAVCKFSLFMLPCGLYVNVQPLFNKFYVVKDRIACGQTRMRASGTSIENFEVCGRIFFYLLSLRL